MEKQYASFKSLDDGSKIFYKTFECHDLKYSDTEMIFSGYANTKNQADAYGDIPTNYEGKAVYDMSRFVKNPVMFVDHANSLTMVMGKFTVVREDDKGLFVELVLRPIEDVHNPLVKDAISTFKSGFGRALSIGGRWYFDDPENPNHLTKAYIHEISGVGVGADGDALVRPKSIEEDQEAKGQKGLEALIKEYRAKPSNDLLNKITAHKKAMQGDKQK